MPPFRPVPRFPADPDAASTWRVRAKVAELADAPALGAGGPWPWGFESPLSHFVP